MLLECGVTMNIEDKSEKLPIDCAQNENVKSFVMCVVKHQSGWKDEGSDNIHKLPRFDVMILKAVGHDNHSAIDDAISECEIIADKIIERYVADSEPGASPRYFTHFKINEMIEDTMEEPFGGDGWVGVCRTVTMGSPRNYILDPNDWQ